MMREQLELIAEKAKGGAESDSSVWPPAKSGVYVVAERSWEGCGEPPESARVLYVGKGDGKQKNQLRKRVGDLVIDMCGYFDKDTGHHTFAYKFKERCPRLDPMELYISWAEADCASCEEIRLYDKFNDGSLLNGGKPSRCKSHSLQRVAP
jgi:hypothetical protein